MTLKACSIPLQRKLNQFDNETVDAAREAYEASGMTSADALRRAVEDHIAQLEQEKRRITKEAATKLGKTSLAQASELGTRLWDSVINNAATLNQTVELARRYFPATSVEGAEPLSVVDRFNRVIRSISTAVQKAVNAATPVGAKWNSLGRVELDALAQMIEESEATGFRPDLPFTDPANEWGRKENADSGEAPEAAYGRVRRQFETLQQVSPAAAQILTDQFNQSVEATRAVVDAQRLLVNRTISDPFERASALGKIDKQWQAALAGRPWIPHRWFGEYVVTSWKPFVDDQERELESEDRVVLDFDTEAEARRALTAIKAAGRQGRVLLKEDYNRTLEGTPRGFVSDVQDAIDKAITAQQSDMDTESRRALETASKELRKSVENLWYASTPEASGARRLMKRKGVAGWQERPENFARAWAQGVVSLHRLAAKMDHMHSLQSVMEDMARQAGRGKTVGFVVSWAEGKGAKRGADPTRTGAELRVFDSMQAMSDYIESMAAKKRVYHSGRMEPGSIPDAVRTLARGYFDKAEADRFEKAYERVLDETQAIQRPEPADPIMAQRYLRVFRNRYADYMVAPPQSKITTFLTNVGYMNYLGWTPAFAFMNMTQVPILTLPLLGSKYGYSAATGALSNAYSIMGQNHAVLSQMMKAAFKGSESDVVDLMKFKGVSDNQLAMLQELLNAGKLDFTQASELHAINAGSPVGWQRVLRSAGWIAHPTEVGNRIVTALAAYNLHMEKGTGAADVRHVNAIRAAIDAVDNSQLDYSSENQMRLLRSPVARIALQFRQFSQQVTWLLGKSIYTALKGESPEVRREALKYLAGVATMTTALAGVRGAPFMGAVLLLASWLGGDDDDPLDAELALRQTIGNGLYDGVFSALGLSVGRSVGLGDLLPGTGGGAYSAPTKREKFEDFMVDSLGPGVGMMSSWASALDKFEQGNAMQGWEALMPKVLRTPITAARLGTEGLTAKNGVVRVEADEFPIHALVSTALGLKTQAVDVAQMQAASVSAREQYLGLRAALLRKRYLMADRMGDATDVAEAEAAIERFNEANPSTPITSKSVSSAEKTRLRAQMYSDMSGGVAMSKEQLKLASELGLTDE